MEENEVKNKRSKHSEKSSKGKKVMIVVIALLIIIIAMVISAIVRYNICLSGTGSSEEKVQIDIAMGSGTSKIASILKENDMIKSELAFKIYVKLNNISSFQAGSYTLTKDMTVPDIIETLQTGKVYKDNQLSITFVEGRTMTYIAQEIASNTNNTETDVFALLENEEYINSLIEEYWFITDEIKDENIYYPLEGYLFPDTYSFESEDVTVEEIFKTLLDQMGKVLEPYREDIENSGYTVHELLTIASIAETEAIYDKDRKDVTSVIYNRLAQGMSIGSDVTTYYAFKIELGSRDLYKSEINTYNPYNTRGPGMEGKLPVRTYLLGWKSFNRSCDISK